MSRKPRHGDRAVVTGHNYVDRVRRADVVARPKIGRRLGESIEPVTPMCIFG